jgi:threonyl-tRNA synthetase
MEIMLPDGSVKKFDGSVSVYDAARAISEGLARAALAGKVDGVLKDLNTRIDKDCRLEILTFSDDEGKEIYRHTCAHVLAQALKNIYPTCKLAIGPAISNGFYYDVDFKTPVTMADLEKIETEMAQIIKADLPLSRFETTKKEALKIMADEPYKQELINDLPEGSVVSFYKQNGFTDMCRGPHLPSTGRIKAFKLTMITGAYWKGNEKNKMLTRIYGTAFDKKADLEKYIAEVEEAKKRDHNKLGRELNIFMTEEKIGQGLPLLMPRGAKIMQILQRFVEDEEERRGYVLTMTPFMAKSDLYKVSGHWDHYRDKMFVIGKEGETDEVLALRPMTCPFQYMIYNNGLKSYRDLPIRYAETSKLFRNEASGEMHGLIRVRQFTLSEGHIICTPQQLQDEFRGVLDLIYYMMDCLGLSEDVTFRFSKWDAEDKEKYIGSAEEWENAQAIMKNILDSLKIKYYEAVGEAAFYGPKLDIQAKNVYGKEDTIITVQIDLFLAQRFGMTYIDEKGEKKNPIIIHRSSVGCYERTLAMLIEKYAGALPLWLSPVQVKVMSLTDRTADKANEIAFKLRQKGIRAEADNRAEKIGYKIREAQLNKIPYMAIIGDKEAENGTVSVRSRKGDLGVMALDNLIETIEKENALKRAT